MIDIFNYKSIMILKNILIQLFIKLPLKELTFRSRIYKWAEDVLGRVGGGQAKVVVPENVTLTLAKNQNHFYKNGDGWLVDYSKFVGNTEKTFAGYTFKEIIVLP